MNDNTYELLLNTFMLYYKKINPNDKIKSMFDNITTEGDTNKPMEMFYEAITDYNLSNHKDALEYSDNINVDKDDFYVLKENDIPVKISDNILSLLIEVINNDYSNWFIYDL